MAAFVDDIGNMGGRDRYIERMICHQERMSNIKPVVRIEAPKHCFEGGTRKTPRPSSAGVARGEFGEVREAFKRILSARPAVDTSTPRGAAEMAQRLSRNRTLGAKQQRYVAEQHERNMKHMARRIANSGSLTERKKNKLDPTLYPPWLLRRVDGGPATAATAETLWRNELLKRTASASSVSAGGVSARLAGGRPSSAPNLARARASRPSTAPAAPAARPASATRKPNRAPLAPRATSANRGAPPYWERAARGPKASAGASSSDGVGGAAYAKLRDQLLRKVVEGRIFREAELRRFLSTEKQRCQRELNPPMAPTLLAAVFRDVEKEFLLP